MVPESVYKVSPLCPDEGIMNSACETRPGSVTEDGGGGVPLPDELKAEKNAGKQRWSIHSGEGAGHGRGRLLREPGAGSRG